MAKPIIRVTNVTKQFSDVRALYNLSLEIEPVIIYGLIGPNGAGKTTLVRLLATLITPTSGSIEVAGLDVVRQANEVRKIIGLAGFDGGKMKEICDACVVVPKDSTPHVEGFHGVLQHLIIFRLKELIEKSDYNFALGYKILIINAKNWCNALFNQGQC